MPMFVGIGTSRMALVRVAWEDRAAPFRWAWFFSFLSGGPGCDLGRRDLLDGLREQVVELAR